MSEERWTVLESARSTKESKTIFFGEGPRSRCYGRIAALRLIVQLCDEDDSLFSFFRVMEHRWNETDRGKQKYSGKILSQCHFLHHKFHMDWPGIEHGPLRWEAGDYRLSHGTAKTVAYLITQTWDFEGSLLRCDVLRAR
jgi:hypothetical protein